MKAADIKDRLKELVKSPRGKNVATFLVFLLISTFFWILMALNDELQRDFILPVKFENVPSDVTLLNNEPLTFEVSLKDKGSSLIRYGWGEPPTVKFNFNDLRSGTNRLVINPVKAANAIRNNFGQATIVALKPDSVIIPYTRRSGKLVHIEPEVAEITAANQYIISGKIKFTPDTVRLYSVDRIPRSLTKVTTVPITALSLTDTTQIEVKLEAPKGMRVIPSTVTATIPVEPIISREITIAVEPINVPRGKKVLTFPSQIEVTLLVPISKYSAELPTVVANANYARRSASKLPLTIDHLPSEFSGVRMQTDSVEYLVED